MIQNYTYHTHTTFSDGMCSIDEMLSQAVRLGFSEYGISDHLQIHDYHPRRLNFEQALPLVKQHIQNVREAADKYSLKVWVGFEVDYFFYDGWLEKFKNFRSQLDVDYLICGNHYTYNQDCTSIYPVLSFQYEDITDSNEQKNYLRRHFAAMRDSVYSQQFDFLAHIDFARWGGLMQDGDYKPEIMEIIDALAETSSAAELNTKGRDRVGSFYPSPWILKEMKVRKIPLVISDDAHHTEQIGRYFAEAEILLQELDYPYRWKLEK